MNQQDGVPSWLRRHEAQRHRIERGAVGDIENFRGGERLKRGTNAFDVLIDGDGNSARSLDVAAFDHAPLLVRRTRDEHAGEKAEGQCCGQDQ
jgi:hypothetical protein